MATKISMQLTSQKTSPTRLAACLLALLCLLLTACGDSYDGPRLRKLDSEAVILAFGDSLTFGTGASKNNSYPDHLANITNFKVVRAGIPGEQTAAGLERLQAVLEQSQPQLVILCLGGNDMLRKKSREKMRANLSTMIETIQEYDAQVVLLGVPEPAIFNLTAEPSYELLAAQHSIPLENEIVAAVLSKPSLKSDPIHPNGDGYKKIAEAIAVLLGKAGAI
jgi:lysophospholipase L1-like esterase